MRSTDAVAPPPTMPPSAIGRARATWSSSPSTSRPATRRNRCWSAPIASSTPPACARAPPNCPRRSRPVRRRLLAWLDRATPFLLAGAVVVGAVLVAWWPLHDQGFRFARPWAVLLVIGTALAAWALLVLE